MFSFITCPLALGFDNTALKNTTFLLRLLLMPPFTATPGRAEREVPMLRALGKSDAMHSPQPAQSLSLSSKYTVTFQWARATRSITFADYVWSSPVPGPFLEQSHVSQLTPGDSLAVRGARTDHSLQVTVSKTTSQSSFITIRYGKGNLFLLILLPERGGQFFGLDPALRVFSETGRHKKEVDVPSLHKTKTPFSILYTCFTLS